MTVSCHRRRSLLTPQAHIYLQLPEPGCSQVGGRRPWLSSSGGFLLPSKSPAAHSVQCIDWFHRAPCRSGLAGNWGGGTGQGAQKPKGASGSADEPGAPHTRRVMERDLRCER